MLQEFRTLIQHSPCVLSATRLLQLMVINMFSVDNTTLKGTPSFIYISHHSQRYSLFCLYFTSLLKVLHLLCTFRNTLKGTLSSINISHHSQRYSLFGLYSTPLLKGTLSLFCLCFTPLHSDADMDKNRKNHLIQWDF